MIKIHVFGISFGDFKILHLGSNFLISCFITQCRHKMFLEYDKCDEQSGDISVW